MNKSIFKHKDMMGDTVEVFQMHNDRSGYRFYVQTRGQPWMTAEEMTEMAVAMTSAAFPFMPTNRPKHSASLVGDGEDD